MAEDKEKIISFQATWTETSARDYAEGDRVKLGDREFVVRSTRLRYYMNKKEGDPDLTVELGEIELDGRDWPGQVFRDRLTGEELMRLREPGDAAIPVGVGGVVIVEGRRYTVAAVEGDEVLLDKA